MLPVLQGTGCGREVIRGFHQETKEPFSHEPNNK